MLTRSAAEYRTRKWQRRSADHHIKAPAPPPNVVLSEVESAVGGRNAVEGSQDIYPPEEATTISAHNINRLRTSDHSRSFNYGPELPPFRMTCRWVVWRSTGISARTKHFRRSGAKSTRMGRDAHATHIRAIRELQLRGARAAGWLMSGYRALAASVCGCACVPASALRAPQENPERRGGGEVLGLLIWHIALAIAMSFRVPPKHLSVSRGCSSMSRTIEVATEILQQPSESQMVRVGAACSHKVLRL